MPVNRGWPVEVEGRSIAVFNDGRRLWAVSNRCMHLESPLDDGFVDHGCVTCQWHGWRYDLSTGDHLTVFGRRPGLRTYPVRTDGEWVEVDVDPLPLSPS